MITTWEQAKQVVSTWALEEILSLTQGGYNKVAIPGRIVLSEEQMEYLEIIHRKHGQLLWFDSADTQEFLGSEGRSFRVIDRHEKLRANKTSAPVLS